MVTKLIYMNYNVLFLRLTFGTEAKRIKRKTKTLSDQVGKSWV